MTNTLTKPPPVRPEATDDERRRNLEALEETLARLGRDPAVIECIRRAKARKGGRERNAA